MTAIYIQSLTKTFDQHTVVDHVTLQVRKGAIFGFLGANGSGKTTMIRMICGLITPTEGTGQCLGYDIKTQGAMIKRLIGYMPQKFSLYAKLTVYETLQFIATLYQLPDPEKAIANILHDLALEPYQNTQVAFLSGGWKQRLTLACCLLHKPALLFLDEPTAGVDPKARKEFWDYLHNISNQAGTTVLVTTHYMDEAEKCTDLAYIYKGRLLYAGTTKALIPYSKVTAYHIVTPPAALHATHQRNAAPYPHVLLSVINNELRMSSPHPERLRQVTQAHPELIFKAIPPTFEEVFIGLMPS